MLKYMLIIGLILASFACSKENTVAPDANIVKTTIDLQMGFANQSVRLYVDSIKLFQALLSSAYPLAGPEASIVTYLRQSLHRIVVARVTLDSISTLYLDTLQLNLTSSNDCFVGLVAVADSVIIKVQDHPFIYLCK